MLQDADHSKKAFEDSVRTILTTFGVFTGFAIKSAIDGIQFPTSPSWSAFLDVLDDSHLFVCIATVALLLRFILGSAVHLNLCYVVEPRSVKPVMLFKDHAFLITAVALRLFSRYIVAIIIRNKSGQSGHYKAGCMRAEVERLVEEIKQSVGLLRRHL